MDATSTMSIVFGRGEHHLVAYCLHLNGIALLMQGIFLLDLQYLCLYTCTIY